ncbi:MAG: DNA topoisomerase (ATP-hydrolyzing) subunit B [Desulfobacteraceae bacterium]|nr:DNA topoisomerase (ATP-hydrolyzing) subunit B [Desulfobacteraceae bacterium]
MSDIKREYNAGSIKILEGLEAVRKRPSMYIGNTDEPGLHHLVYEVVDNSIDEAMAGYCTEIDIKIHTDNSVTVTDNGRGIPVDLHEKEGVPAAEVVLTKLHAGGKFDNDTYKVSGGLHGVGISVVNALSENLDMTIWKNGNIYNQKFSKGKKITELEIIGSTDQNGTKIHFSPDITIMSTNNFNYEVLSRRMRELAFLNKGIRISIEDERSDEKNSFMYEGGIKTYVEFLNKHCSAIHDPIIIEGTDEDVFVEVAIQYNDTFNEKIYTFANNINTSEGGYHLSGFKGALTRTLNNYANSDSLPKNQRTKISGDDVREGLSAVISVKLKEPKFEGQTKTKLGNSEVKGIVESLVNEKLAIYLEENPSNARKIIAKAVEAARARDAAKRARDLARSKSNIGDTTLPGKLADCQSNKPEEKELYLVEGDSAGGSAKQARDRRFQAILPLKGKILNVEKARFDKLLKSDEIKNMITALGAGIGRDDYEIDKIRYHKIFIMTDADVDGAHIRTLLLTFFYRHMPEIIEKGYLYIAQPPLYRIGKGKKGIYLKNESGFNEYLVSRFCEFKYVESGEENKKLEDSEAFEFILKLISLYENLASLDNMGFEKRIVKILLDEKVSDKDYLRDEEKMSLLRDKFEQSNFVIDEFIWNEEKDIFELTLTPPEVEEDHESEESSRVREKKPVRISRRLVFSKEYQSILSDWSIIEKYYNLPFHIGTKEGTSVVKCETLREFYNKAMEEAKKGVSIQRYKGLGEMNPDQLWETTMDPSTRQLLQVKVEDAEAADEIFSLLMGDEVEPRRNFIKTHALEVSTLDY